MILPGDAKEIDEGRGDSYRHWAIGVGLERANFQRIAALALYNQSFGFVWSDVVELRHAAIYFGPGTQAGVRLNRLADLIAALLPPE